MKNITIRYGSDIREVTVESSTTVAQLLADSTNRVVLGYGDNVQALIGGIAQPGDVVVPSGSTVVIENKANSKAF
jgi:hypothetical protein